MKRPCNTSERAVKFSLYQRFLLTFLLGRQTMESLRKAIGGDVRDDDAIALYSVRRKVKTESDELVEYSQRIGKDTHYDLTQIQNLPATVKSVSPTLDGGEIRILRVFLAGWLKVEATLADREWVEPLLAQLQ